VGLNEVFLGFIVLAIVGNAAEHSTAVMLAVRGQMDTALNISMQSSVQIALFVTRCWSSSRTRSVTRSTAVHAVRAPGLRALRRDLRVPRDGRRDQLV